MKSSVIAVFILVTGLQSVQAKESLGEDPFAVGQTKHKTKGDRPWADKPPEELQKWAKNNLHRKLTARMVIDAEAHPEWAWFRKAGLGLFLHWV